jgi:hypothetical protein
VDDAVDSALEPVKPTKAADESSANREAVAPS